MSTVFAERPRFFEGQYLGADDLQAFLRYARQHDARHLLGAHTWGIVAGIDLIDTTSPTGDAGYVLTPGVAVDGYGRLLVVAEPFVLTTDLFASQPSGTVNVWIRYEETERHENRPGYQVCDCSDEFARVDESVVVEVGPHITVGERQSGVAVGDDTYVDAREALGHHLPGQPLACDGSVPPQAFPGEGDRDLWLIPVGQVAWSKPGAAFQPRSDADRKASRIFRRAAGLVAESLVPSEGVLRLRPRWTPRQAGVSHDQVCGADAIAESDIVDCGGELTFKEMIWLEGDVRFRHDARIYGGRLEFQEATGTDYLDTGTVLAIRRRPDRNEHTGFDLQVLLGKPQGTDGPTRLTIGQAEPKGPDPCSIDFDFDAGVYVQQDAKVGIGTTASLLALPLTIRGVGDAGDLVGFESSGGTLAWQINFGTGLNGLNFTEDDPAETRLFLETGGEVGIGTLTPEAKLDIQSVSAPMGNALGANMWLRVGNGGDGGRVWLQYGDQLAPLLVMSDLDDPSRIQFQQVGTGGENAPEFASWIGMARGKSTDLAVMNGLLGVGTLDPFVRLTVDGSLGFKSGGDPMIFIYETGTNNAERMVFAHSPDYTNYGLRYRDSDDSVHLIGNGTAALSVELAGDRHVGIGTTSPAERLDVRGNIKLGTGGDYFGVGGLDNVRMITGRCSDGGARLWGTGFTSTRTGEGRYRITYGTAFSAVPVVVVTLVDAAARDNAVTVESSTAATFEVRVRDVANAGEGSYQDTAFNFVALGPRA